MDMEKLNVQGIAIRPCVSRNGIKYTAEELKKFAPTMEGRPILIDHRHDDISKNVGLITKSLADNEGVVSFEGWIKDAEGIKVKERLQDGRLKEVSIGAIAGKMVKEKDDDVYPIAVDLESLELSIISCAGVKNTKITQAAESYNDLTQEELDKIEKTLEEETEKSEEDIHNEPEKVQDDEIEKEENIMADEQKPEEKQEAESTPAAPPAMEKADAGLIEATKTLLEEVKTLKTQISELKNAKEKAEASFKTKDAEVAKVAESCEGYCIEQANKGLAFWKMPENKGMFTNDTAESFKVMGGN